MASDPEFVDFVVDHVENAGEVTSRKMFGEYAVYCEGKVVALICDNRLLIKPTNAGREFIGDVVEEPPYPGAKPAFLIEDRIDDTEWLSHLVRITERELPMPKKKKKRRPKEPAAASEQPPGSAPHSPTKEVRVSGTDFSRLSRPIHTMPEFVSDALAEHGLLEAYRSRPAYQQNDYVGWITRAKRTQTKEKRLHQMLEELRSGDVYMKMKYEPARGQR